MPTLAQLQDRMNGADQEDAREAATELSNFYFVYNEEYNGLQDKETEAEIAYDKATHNDVGVDQAEAMRLTSFILSAKSRMATLDLKMRAFHKTGLSIKPPTQALVNEVKLLSSQVSKLIARDKSLEGVIKALTDIATLVNKSMA